MSYDEATITIKSGNGGNGIIAFRREKYIPRGGPSGGDGGKGGDVYFVVRPTLNTLIVFNQKHSFQAEHGQHGGQSDRTGRGGEDLLIEVPPGTLVRNADTGALIADLVEPGQQVMVAKGGRGGRGNARYATSTNQAPRYAEKGEPGEEYHLQLELKLLADIGLVGAPNAGKSTLLSVLSNAKPKIADYPFTTLEPNLGVAMIDHRDLVLADIPGLIEGAHAGVGLGHDFLRHIQRTRVLIHVLDGSAEDPLADFHQINTELSLFDERLGEKPQIVAFNKMDLPDAQARWPEVREALQALDYEVMEISAATHRNTRDVLNRAVQILDDLPEVVPNDETEKPVYQLGEDPFAFEVARDRRGAFHVTGKRIERAVDLT